MLEYVYWDEIFSSMDTQQELQGTKWTDYQKRLIFATVAKDVKSKADQALFESVCLSSGLDPLRKEIYAVMRKGRMAIQTGIDGYLKLANQTKELDGMQVFFYDETGCESEVWIKEKPPAACMVRVYRKGSQYPFTASCRFAAYTQSNHMWSKFPETMLAKATTTLALRRGFADVIAGIASADEMDQADASAPEALWQGLPQDSINGAPEETEEAPPAPKSPQAGKKEKARATAKKAPAAAAAKESEAKESESISSLLEFWKKIPESGGEVDELIFRSTMAKANLTILAVDNLVDRVIEKGSQWHAAGEAILGLIAKDSRWSEMQNEAAAKDLKKSISEKASPKDS